MTRKNTSSNGGALLGLLLGAGAVGVVVALTRSRRDDAAPAPRPAPRPRLPQTPPTPQNPYVYGLGVDPLYSMPFWGTIVAAMIQAEFPRVKYDFAMRWIRDESQGNVCSVGEPGKTGPDGNPVEIGLGQLYNPDDFRAFGISAAPFRAYCAPGTQRRTRELTAAEISAQVRETVLRKIDRGIDTAHATVATYGLQGWSDVDFWRLVKAPHGYPPILNTGMPAVVKKLGRAPRDWNEFRTVLGMDEMVLDTDKKSKTFGEMIPKFPPWHNGLNACEKMSPTPGIDKSANV